MWAVRKELRDEGCTCKKPPAFDNEFALIWEKQQMTKLRLMVQEQLSSYVRIRLGNACSQL